ncbi:MAG: nuclear transport factor 2 family protein [Proteobacteria bacterium]|nr:nuclear transport factor 2 family protein [Pseudomonadota bacterium]
MIPSAVTDEAAIWSLMCHYCHLVDRGDMADVVALFHPEGTLILPPDPPATGREAMARAYEKWAEGARKPTVWLRHRIDTPWIRIDGDRAVSVCYLTADFLLRKKQRVQTLVGRYEDELIRHEGRWMFWRREIVIASRIDLGPPL